MKIVKTLIAALACLAVIGCNSEDAQNIGQDAKNLAQHTGEALSGMTLQTKVTTALTLRKDIDIKPLKISADKHGVVTLEGTVKSEEDKRKIIDAVDNTVGVETVIDKLKVGS